MMGKHGKNVKPDFDSDPGWEGVEEWVHAKPHISQVRRWLEIKRESSNPKPVTRGKGKKPATRGKGKKPVASGKGKKPVTRGSQEVSSTGKTHSKVKSTGKTHSKVKSTGKQRGIQEFAKLSGLGTKMVFCFNHQ